MPSLNGWQKILSNVSWWPGKCLLSWLKNRKHVIRRTLGHFWGTLKFFCCRWRQLQNSSLHKQILLLQWSLATEKYSIREHFISKMMTECKTFMMLICLQPWSWSKKFGRDYLLLWSQISGATLHCYQDLCGVRGKLWMSLENWTIGKIIWQNLKLWLISYLLWKLECLADIFQSSIL